MCSSLCNYPLLACCRESCHRGAAACTFPLHPAPCWGQPPVGCSNSFILILLIGKKVSSVDFLFFPFFLGLQVLCWAQGTVSGASTGAWARASRAWPQHCVVLWGQLERAFGHSGDLVVNYCSNAFPLFHCASYTSTAQVLKLEQ